MKNKEIEVLRLLAKSWNNLNASFIESILIDDCIYESQWVLKPLEGKHQFLFYINSKFDAIKNVMKSEIMAVTAEMAFHPAISQKPCLVLTQITNQGLRQACILVKMKDDKIERIDVCFIPDPSEAILTGEIPN
jgi:hypothetical protein